MPAAIRRVLHIFPLCGTGGTEAAMRGIIRALADLDVESEAFFEREAGGKEAFESLCPTHFSSTQSLSELLQAGRFDALCLDSSSLTTGVLSSLRAAGYAGGRVVVCHGDYIVGWNRANAHRCIALTKWWKTRIAGWTDLPVDVIGNPVDVARFAPPKKGGDSETRPPLVGWVGRCSDHRKNVSRLISVMRSCSPELCRFVVANGDPNVPGSAVFGELAGSLDWYGRLSPDQMPAFYARIAASGGCLLSTSDSEAYPLCVVEALSSGCPVVVPAAFGSDELVQDGVTGFLYSTSEGVGAIVDRLRQVFEPRRWTALSAHARDFAEHHCKPGLVARAYLRAFEAAAASELSNQAALQSRLAELQAVLRPPAPGISSYRRRLAEEKLGLATASDCPTVELRYRHLREALKAYPPAFASAWRIKFLIKTIASHCKITLTGYRDSWRRPSRR